MISKVLKLIFGLFICIYLIPVMLILMICSILYSILIGESLSHSSMHVFNKLLKETEQYITNISK